MASIVQALSNCSDYDLQKLVGFNTIRLLSKIDEANVRKSILVSLLIKRYGNEILLNDEIRKHIIWGLREKEVATLSEKITGSSNWDDNYDKLINTAIIPNSVSSQKLYDFFNLEIIDSIESVAARESEKILFPAYPLYPYQNQIVKKIISQISSKENRAMIHMPTGSGKTRAAMNVICRYLCSEPNKIVIWLAHSEELSDQASDEFEKAWSFLGNRQLTLGRYYAEHEIDLGKFKEGLIVAGLQKLYSRSGTLQSDFLRLKMSVGLVIIDEAHQAIAPTYKHLLDMLAPYGGAALIGLSATPGRSWLEIDKDQKLSDFFNGCKIKLEIENHPNPILYLQEKGYLSVPEYQYIDYTPSLELEDSDRESLAQGFDISLKTLKRLGSDDVRNLLIINAILQEVKGESKIVVFACSVENAELIADILSLKDVNARAISSGSSSQLRRESIESFKSNNPGSVQVLVNFGILTTGFDAPKTSVAVVARPTQSVVLYSQMIGRAMRGSAVGGNTHCKIITVVDAFPGFRSVSEGFSHWEDVWENQ